MSELVKNNNQSFGSLLDEFFGNASGWNKSDSKFPPVNINETAKDYELDLFAPGLDKNDFKINLENGLLTITYDKKTDTTDKKSHRTEYDYTSFKRSFTIDDHNIDASKINATYEKGVLKLILPKKEVKEVAPKQIEVK